MADQVYRVVAEALNVRPEPRIQGQPIGILKHGEEVNRLDVSENGYWYKIKTGDGLIGWSAHKYLMPVLPESASTGADFPWLRIALAEQGVREVSGDGANPRIVEYLHSTTLPAADENSDETLWCSAFVNWCVERAGYEGTDSAEAKSWLSWGTEIQVPRRGCIAVFSRVGGGHVGFYMGETGEAIKLLAGNQSNEVNQADRDKATLLGYRLPPT